MNSAAIMYHALSATQPAIISSGCRRVACAIRFATFLGDCRADMAAAEAIVLHKIANGLQGLLVRRYKRFFADVLLDGREEAAHCPNTGSMCGLLDDLGKTPCLVSKSDNPKRKLKYSLHAILSAPPSSTCAIDPTFVGIHSANANKLATAALESGALASAFGGASLAATEQFLDALPTGSTGVSAARKRGRLSVPRSRVDLVLQRPDGSTVALEVKSISMTDYLPNEAHSAGRDIAHVDASVYRRTALFPDSVSLRAQRHVEELTARQLSESPAVKRKSSSSTSQTLSQRAASNCLTCSAAMLLVIQRGDARGFAPCDRVDPTYGQLLREAVASGVGVAAMVVDIAADGTHTFKGMVPIFATHADAVRHLKDCGE